MKFLKLLILIASFLLFSNTVNAITTYAEWQNSQTSIQINRGDQVYFDYSLFSINPPIKYSVKMYDSNTNLIRTFIDDTSTNNNLVSARQYITQADYSVNGIYTILVGGTDNFQDSDSITLTLQVGTGINNAPILNPIGNKQINEGQLLQFTITATDLDNDSLTLTATNLPINSQFTDQGNGNGIFTWTPNFNNAGNYNLRFIVSDSQLTDFEDIVITVIDVPQVNPPTVTIQAPQLNEIISGIYNVRWTATDPDQIASTLDIRIEYTYNGLAWITLEDLQDNNDGIFAWDTTQLSDANDYQIRITARDDNGNIAQALVVFAVDNLFSPNINIIQPQNNFVISRTYNILWQATDVDQSNATLDIKIEYRDPFNVNNNIFTSILNLFGITLTHWITLEDLQDNNDGIFTWDTRTVQDGSYQLRITVRDDNNNFATAFVSSFIIANQAVNNNPIIISTPVINAIVGKLYNYDVDAIDPDNDPLTYLLMSYPQGMNINANTGLISWIPNAKGNYNIIVQVRDNFNGIAQQSFTINVVTEIFSLTGKEFAEKHSFIINNVILKQNKNDLNVLINLDNKGNNKEDIKLIVTNLFTGKVVQDNIELSINEGTWKLTTLKNIGKGRHIIKVEAISKAFKDSRYAFIYMN